MMFQMSILLQNNMILDEHLFPITPKCAHDTYETSTITGTTGELVLNRTDLLSPKTWEISSAWIDLNEYIEHYSVVCSETEISALLGLG